MQARLLSRLPGGVLVCQMTVSNAVLRVMCANSTSLQPGQQLWLSQCKWNSRSHVLECAHTALFTSNLRRADALAAARGPELPEASTSVLFLSRLSVGVFVGRVAATNAVLRFACPGVGPAFPLQRLDALGCVWDKAQRYLVCRSVAQWPLPLAAVRKRKAL